MSGPSRIRSHTSSIKYRVVSLLSIDVYFDMISKCHNMSEPIELVSNIYGRVVVITLFKISAAEMSVWNCIRRHGISRCRDEIDRVWNKDLCKIHYSTYKYFLELDFIPEPILSCYRAEGIDKNMIMGLLHVLVNQYEQRKRGWIKSTYDAIIDKISGIACLNSKN